MSNSIGSIGQGVSLAIPQLQGNSPEAALQFQKDMAIWGVVMGALTSAVETVGKAEKRAVDAVGQQ
jgi:hypothetical protein